MEVIPQKNSAISVEILVRTSYHSFMRTIPREVFNVKEPRRDYTPTLTKSVAQAYLQGALHDSTYNTRHRTFRFTQSNKDWLLFLQKLLTNLGFKSWIYREGEDRSVYALETTANFLDYGFSPHLLNGKSDQIAYIRGYFDAEGGFPKSSSQRLYIYFAQKNFDELNILKEILTKYQIQCGKIHNPSKKADPEYFRFYVKSQSQQNFIHKIGSWHPRKWKDMIWRMKI